MTAESWTPRKVPLNYQPLTLLWLVQDDDMEEGEAEPGEMPSLKRLNPIARQTPPKKQRVGDVNDASPDDTPERQAGSTSASRANSSRQPQPSPANGVAS